MTAELSQDGTNPVDEFMAICKELSTEDLYFFVLVMKQMLKQLDKAQGEA